MKRNSLLHAAVGCALLLAAWELAGRRAVLGKTLPAFSQVLAVYALPARRALLARSAAATVSAALRGFTAGSLAGIAVALLAHLAPALRRGLDRLSVLVNALPVIALGPVLVITAGRESAPAALAAVPVFFVLYTATSHGLRSAGVELHAVLTTLGATGPQRLARLEAVSALPEILTGARLAVGSAMIGAVVGEWFGAPTGLGIVVLNSMQNFQIPLLWAAVAVIATLTLAAYGALLMAERALRQRLG